MDPNTEPALGAFPFARLASVSLPLPRPGRTTSRSGDYLASALPLRARSERWFESSPFPCMRQFRAALHGKTSSPGGSSAHEPLGRLRATLVPRFDRAPHNFDALPRHRLLRQPDGFEGVGLAAGAVQRDALLPPPPHQLPDRRLEGDIAAGPMTTEPDERERDLAEISYLAGLDGGGSKDGEKVSPRSVETHVAPIGAALKLQIERTNSTLSSAVEPPLRVSAVEGLDGSVVHSTFSSDIAYSRSPAASSDRPRRPVPPLLDGWSSGSAAGSAKRHKPPAMIRRIPMASSTPCFQPRCPPRPRSRADQLTRRLGRPQRPRGSPPFQSVFATWRREDYLADGKGGSVYVTRAPKTAG